MLPRNTGSPRSQEAQEAPEAQEVPETPEVPEVPEAQNIPKASHDCEKAKPLRYRRHQRLSGKNAYSRVFNHGKRRTSGPLTLFACPNDLDYDRLGLSISRKVGGAVTRTKIKRRLREAFRHLQHEFKLGCDYVIVCRKHKPLAMQDYQKLLFGAMRHHQAQFSRNRTPNNSEGKND